VNRIAGKKIIAALLCGLVGSVTAAPPYDPQIEELKKEFNRAAVCMSDRSRVPLEREHARQHALEIAQTVLSLNPKRHAPTAFRGFVLGDFNTNAVNTNAEIRQALNELARRLASAGSDAWRRIAEEYRVETERVLKQLEDLAEEGMMR